METALDTLKQRLVELSDLGAVAGLLAWDQATMMPRRGAAVRAEQMATLAGFVHQRFVDPEIGRLLDAAAAETASLPPDADDACLVRVSRRDWEKQRRVPAELAADLAHAGSVGREAWRDAKANANFAAFLPAFARNVELKRRYIDCFDQTGAPYDVLIDDFEQDLTAAEITVVFDRLKAVLPALVDRVRDRADRVDDACFTGRFAAADQKALMLRIIGRMGYDSAGWRLDPTEHPFAQRMATTDVRLTTHYDEANLANAFFGTIHELGHGLYEEGVDPTLERTPLSSGCSMVLHESQSRLWENVVGRGRPFWDFAFPLLRETFPTHFAETDAEALHRAANRMRPSLIRVEADELTYPLHIILRFELERDLFNGDLQPADVPDAWNAKMRDYLGIDVPSADKGVLQDVHWSEGLYGYFATYALGTLLSVQIWERAQTELPGLDVGFAEGAFLPLREWLRERLHRHGRKFTPKETIVRVAGGPLDPEPYLRYISAKVDALYGA